MDMNWKFIICLIAAGIFTYGKYFVISTEIGKLSYTISVYMWIVLGVLFLILDKIGEKNGYENIV